MLDSAYPCDHELLTLESRHCSHGDTVHYVEPPKVFTGCDGSYMYDASGVAYLDLQMWYSAVNFGYRNPRLNAALIRQLDTLPQIASQYVHREKVELATVIARDAERKFGLEGRVHFNVGGAQAIEDSLKLVRNAKGGKAMMFAFEGGYHGRTLGASAITSSYRYRRRFGHFADRAQFVPFPYCFRCPYGKQRDSCNLYCVGQIERLFDTEYAGLLDPKTGDTEVAAFYIEPIQGTGGYIRPPEGYFERLKTILEARKILLVDDEIQMGFYRAGKLWAIENFNVTPDVIVFGKAATNGLNPLSGLWAREELINPAIFPPGSTHSTFNANPLGTAVALETMKMLSERDYETKTREKGAYFLAGLRDLKARHAIVGDVDGIGLALRMEICEPHDSFTPSKRLADKMVVDGLSGQLEIGNRQLGCILDIGGYYKNVVTLAPSLDISRDEIDLALRLLDQLLVQAVRSTA